MALRVRGTEALRPPDEHAVVNPFLSTERVRREAAGQQATYEHGYENWVEGQ